MEYLPSKSLRDLRIPGFHCAFAGTGCRPNLGKYLLKEKFLLTRFLKRILIPQIMRASSSGKINDLGNKRFRLLFGDYTKCKVPRGHFMRKRFSYMSKKKFDHIFFQLREKSNNLTRAYALTFSSALSGYWKTIPMWYNHKLPRQKVVPTPAKVEPKPAAEEKPPVSVTKVVHHGPPPPRGLREKQMLQGLLDSLSFNLGQGQRSLATHPRPGMITTFKPFPVGEDGRTENVLVYSLDFASSWDGKAPHLCGEPHGSCDRNDPVVWVSELPMKELRRLALWGEAQDKFLVRYNETFIKGGIHPQPS
jgi:hypothetical protein